MSRTGRRISRGLIAFLVVVVLCGGGLYFHNTNKTAAKAKAGSGRVEPSPLAMAPAAVSAVVPINSMTPTSNQPTSNQPTSNAPSTRPSALSNDKNPASNTPANNTAANNTPANSTPAANINAASALSDGLAKKETDLLAARALLNQALASNQLSADDTAKCKAAIGEISQTVVFSPKRFADDEYGGSYSVQSGDLLKKIAEKHDTTWELLARVNNLSDPKKLRAGQTIKVIKGPFHAVVSKRTFTMDLYVGAAPGETGSMYVMTLPVGLGRDDSTPTGVWMVEPHKKIKNPTYFSPRGEGVINADDPKNPLGERWIGLAGIDGHAVGKESYGIHGTIEPDSIGKMASMGCIRMRNEDVEKVFDLLVEGKSTVIVKD